MIPDQPCRPWRTTYFVANKTGAQNYRLSGLLPISMRISCLDLFQERNKWEAVTEIWKKKYEELLVEKVELEQQIKMLEVKHHGSVSTNILDLKHYYSVQSKLKV